VLSSDDFFRDFVQIIRLRFPFCGIWDLPVAAHEFGHFVAGQLNLTRMGGAHYLAVQEYKSGFMQQNSEIREEWGFWLEEYFADVFATFALGPAYGFTCLLLRFDPASAYQQLDNNHPVYARRVHVILQTLLRMDREHDTRGHLAILRATWQDLE